MMDSGACSKEKKSKIFFEIECFSLILEVNLFFFFYLSKQSYFLYLQSQQKE